MHALLSLKGSSRSSSTISILYSKIQEFVRIFDIADIHKRFALGLRNKEWKMVGKFFIRVIKLLILLKILILLIQKNQNYWHNHNKFINTEKKNRSKLPKVYNAKSKKSTEIALIKRHDQYLLV